MLVTKVIKQKMAVREELGNYTFELIIGRCQLKQSTLAISRNLGISRSTVNDCVERYKNTGSGINQKRSGRPLKLTEREQRTIICSFREKPFTSFVDHNRNLKDVGINITRQTLSVHASRLWLGSYSPAFVPNLNDDHIEKRLKWATDKVNWTDEW